MDSYNLKRWMHWKRPEQASPSARLQEECVAVSRNNVFSYRSEGRFGEFEMAMVENNEASQHPEKAMTFGQNNLISVDSRQVAYAGGDGNTFARDFLITLADQIEERCLQTAGFSTFIHFHTFVFILFLTSSAFLQAWSFRLITLRRLWFS